MQSSATTRAQPTLLSRGEAEQLRQIARRLRGELRTALDGLPQTIDGPTALCEQLGLDRATAHRLLQLARCGGGEFRWLQRGPGVQAIRQFARTCQEHGVDPGTAASVEAAADRYDEIISALAGSKSKLMRRLEATEAQLTGEEADVDGAGRERLRAQLFENAAALIGRQMDVRVDMIIIRPSDDKAGWYDHAWIRGVVGHRARPNGPALSIGYHVAARRGGDDQQSTLPARFGDPLKPGERRASILDEFSTQPPPLMISRGKGDRVTQVIDPKATAEGEAVDVVVAYRHAAAIMHPRHEDTPVLEFNALVREPTRALLFDVYLHRELAQGAIPDLALYLWSPGLERSLADHWYDQLPTQATLQVLGTGLNRAGSPLHARHADLTAHVFEQLNWLPDQYIGFRCAVQYPLWGGTYAITFDYDAMEEE